MSESFELVGPPPGDRSPELVSQGYDSPLENPPRYFLAASLFMLTFFSTTTLGAGWYLSTRTNLTTSLLPWMAPETIVSVWTDFALLSFGLRFSIPLLFFFLCHEFGHYLACRFYKLPSTLPYFLPAPIGLGTFGAFIKIKAPIRRKIILFDVGIAGPLAGFAALLPFLAYGMWHSVPGTVQAAQEPEVVVAQILVPGHNMLLQVASRFFHGPLEPGAVIDFHPFALAAWVGMFATAINLLPIGQLDGGHILFAVAGRLQRWLGPACWIALAVAGVTWGRVWLFFAAFILVIIGLRHPPIADADSPLGSARRWAAIAALLIFVLVFIPVPLSIIYLAN